MGQQIHVGYIMACRVAAISMVLSDPRGCSLIASLFKWNFSCIYYAVIDKISTDIVRRGIATPTSADGADPTGGSDSTPGPRLFC